MYCGMRRCTNGVCASLLFCRRQDGQRREYGLVDIVEVHVSPQAHMQGYKDRRT